MRHARQPSRQRGAPPDVEVVYLFVIDVVALSELPERVDLLGEDRDVVVDIDRR
ncbi:hypothetical protein [Mycobacterium colombiense]|uniref:hypothetical protein n=1 Tax=Mycobacterium colombiense TaxID=339268 RepID=UPI00197B110A|nr:hypothetical protein [Mycobacterium colombiense]